MTTSSRPSNPYLTDPSLSRFLSSTFSATDYLNSTLPPLETTRQQKAAPSLSTIVSQTQSQVSALNAQTSRLSATLTSLTDEILRTSSRLAYEVELLRGEALSLADTLSSKGDLNEDILKFVPTGLNPRDPPSEAPDSPVGTRHASQGFNPSQSSSQPQSEDRNPGPIIREPEALPRLRTLLHVRAQLQTVIQRFNLALSFPLPPSLLSTSTSSLISVNPPNQDHDLESKGQAALARLKQEVTDLLVDAEGRGGGAERARARVAELRELCAIWKGTGEEKARTKWVDGLEQMVDDDVRRKEESKRKGEGGVKPDLRKDTSTIKATSDASGPGFLRRLREEIYME